MSFEVHALLPMLAGLTQGLVEEGFATQEELQAVILHTEQATFAALPFVARLRQNYESLHIGCMPPYDTTAVDEVSFCTACIPALQQYHALMAPIHLRGGEPAAALLSWSTALILRSHARNYPRDAPTDRYSWHRVFLHAQTLALAKDRFAIMPITAEVVPYLEKAQEALCPLTVERLAAFKKEGHDAP